MTVARFDGSRWTRLDAGIEAQFSPGATVLTEFGEGADRRLIAGGSFHRGSSEDLVLALWTGDAWQPLAQAQYGEDDRPSVLDGVVEPTGAHPSLWVVGAFDGLEGVPSWRAARYDDPGAFAAGGSVNAGAGAVTDELFVNDSTGGARRRIELVSHEPVSAFVAVPPAATAGARFSLYVWKGEPRPGTACALPFGLGSACLPTPLTPGVGPQPALVWNNTGRTRLGAPSRASTPAPSRVFRLPLGTGRPATFFLQGIIADPGSAADRPASATNGITVVVR